MTKRILFFSAGRTLTEAEAASVDMIRQQAEKPYDVIVLNSEASSMYGHGLIQADFVAGDEENIPDGYKGDPEAEPPVPAVPVYDPEEPPTPDLPETQAVVSNGDELTIGETTYTFTVAGGVITAIATA